MEVIIGATSRVAEAYVNYLGKNIEDTILFSRTKADRVISNLEYKPGGQYSQDLTQKDFTDLYKILENKDISRILYFAVSNLSKDLTLNEFNQINVGAPQKILEKIKDKNLQFIYFSSDQVFGGLGKVCDEESLLSPINNYGKSKANGEKVVLDHSSGKVIRLGNVLGIRGDFLFSATERIKKGETYSAWKNIFNTFTGIKDIIRVLKSLNNYQGDRRIFHVSSSEEPISRFDMAKSFFQLLESKEKIPLGFSKLIQPTYGSLENGRPKLVALNSNKTYNNLGLIHTPILSQLESLVDTTDYPFL